MHKVNGEPFREGDAEMQPNMPMLGVRVPQPTADQLRRVAASEGNTSIIIRRFITEGLAKMEKRKTT